MNVTFSRDASWEDDDTLHAGEVVSLEFEVTGSETWMEYIEYFNRFLSACGYIAPMWGQFVEEINIDES
jgi:hypothetical protein